jgi:hypothetical protein
MLLESTVKFVNVFVFSEEKDGAESSDDSDEDCGDEIKPKTRKQRRKEKERKSEERKKMYLKNDMVRNFNRC